MKLTALSLPSFRSYVGVELDVDAPRVMICGVNGAGKTTCREAIRWALTGRCESTDAKGSGAELLAPYGTEAVAAAVALEGIGDVVRSRRNGSHTLAVGSFTGELTTQQRALYEAVGPQAFLEAVLETSSFLRLHHADAKALVLTLLDVRIPVEDRLLTLDELEAEYTEAFAARRAAKVRLKDFALPPAPDQVMPTLEDVDAQLETLRSRLGTASTDAAKIVGQRLVLERQVDELRAKGTVEPSTAVPRLGLEARIGELTAAIDRAEQALEATRAEQAEQAKRAAAGSRQASDLGRLIAVLTEHSPKQHGCVLDPNVPCETSKHKFNHRVKLLRSELDALGGAPETPNEETVDLSALRSELRGLQAALTAYRTADQANADRTARLAALDTELAALPPAPQDGDPDAEQLKVRIRKGELLRQSVSAHWAAHEARRKAIEKQKALQAEVDRLEGACELLGPNGVRVGALADALQPFQAKVNAFTERFGWQVTFQVEPWGVFVNGRPVQTYSESEQFRIGIALQLAVAEVSGLSFAVIDRLDMLDLKNRKLVADMVLAAPVGQVILLTTREANQPLPEMEGVIAYRLALRNGRTEVIESTGVTPMQAPRATTAS